jgi:D-glycero-D-manno-heptose 1,7-bisphosphate phosphatase
MKNKALFLDRDGVINVEKNYVHRIEDFEFVEGIFDVARFFYERGYKLFVVTNQAGIGRGYYTENDFHILTDWMLNKFQECGIEIKKVYYCPFHPQHGIGKYKQESLLRKPNPGMLLKAQKEFGIDLSSSILIGDKETDIVAGIRAKIGITILLTNESNPNSQADIIINKLGDIFNKLYPISEI